jgi:prevent-host-death family protein
MRTIDIHDAKTHLFELVEQAARGASFLIAKSGTPRVMVIPVEALGVTRVRPLGFLAESSLAPEEVDGMGSGSSRRGRRVSVVRGRATSVRVPPGKSPA